MLSALSAQHGEYVFAWQLVVEAVVLADVPPNGINELVLT